MPGRGQIFDDGRRLDQFAELDARLPTKRTPPYQIEWVESGPYQSLRLIHLIDGEIRNRRDVQLKGRKTMLATRNIRKKAKRFAGVNLTDSEAFEADTVSPHDRDALKVVAEKWGIQDRLPSLIRGAARSRDLCEVHRCVARESIRAARSAKELGNGVSYRDYLKTATDARRRASECHHFARQCEDRAHALITAGSSSPPDFACAQEAIASDAESFLPPNSIKR